MHVLRADRFNKHFFQRQRDHLSALNNQTKDFLRLSVSQLVLGAATHSATTSTTPLIAGQDTGRLGLAMHGDLPAVSCAGACTSGADAHHPLLQQHTCIPSTCSLLYQGTLIELLGRSLADASVQSPYPTAAHMVQQHSPILVEDAAPPSLVSSPVHHTTKSLQ